MRRPEAALILLLVGTALGAFDPDRDLGVAVAGGHLILQIPEGVHLKRSLFKVVLDGPGQLQAGPLPEANGEDEAGEPIWRGTIRVALSGTDLTDPARLVVTLQPCTEGKDGVCYLPLKRRLTVRRAEIPAGKL